MPDDRPSYLNFIKHIPKLLYITQAPIYCIATKTIDNAAAGTMAFMDLLDEAKPHWWQHPPQELTELTPVHPPIRVLKQNAEGTSRELEQHAFILTFNNSTVNPNGNIPDTRHPWYWMAHPDQILPRMAPNFQIDTANTNADIVQARLQDPTNTTINKCTWSQKITTRRPGLAHRTTFQGTPREGLQSFIEREIYVKLLDEWCSATTDTYVGDLLSRKHPHALYVTTTSDEVWKEIPRHYFTSLILLNGRLAIMHTGQSAVAWTALMTSQEEADANSKITRINWKTSTMGGHTWATPNTITAQRQQWFTGQPAEEPGGDDDQQPHLIIHIPEYLHTTPEVMGPKVTRIIQKHDGDANLDDSNAEGIEHQVQPIKDVHGLWNGSFKYTAPSYEVAAKAQKELNGACLTTEFCQSRPTTEIKADPRYLAPPPDDPGSKNAKEGRYCGPLSSFQ